MEGLQVGSVALSLEKQLLGCWGTGQTCTHSAKALVTFLRQGLVIGRLT